jgi:N-acetylmuramoyl-L-alanine amidase
MALRSRSERLEEKRAKRKRWRAVAAVLSVTVGLGAAILGVGIAANRGDASSAEPASLSTVSIPAGVDASSTSTAGVQPLIEVPALTGLSLDEAVVVLESAGLVVDAVGTPAGEEPSGTVLAQSPDAGERVTAGTVVQVVWADPSAARSADASSRRRPVVCIDPGHQAKANNAAEPVGPGSAETKAKVSAGARGVVTGRPEHEVVLSIALKVKERLEARGVTVVMTRIASDVDISNAQRARVANEAHADLFMRIHADSNTNAEAKGVSTLYPSGNQWVAPIEKESLRAARFVHQAVIRATGAPDRGLKPRADLAGFNWSAVPAVLVEAGFMSNPVEDRLLSDAAYQDKVAAGIAEGVLAYLADLERGAGAIAR